MPRPHGYCIIEVSDLDPRQVLEELAARPSMGLGLPTALGAACSMGNLPARQAELLDQARHAKLPPVGTRLVIARSNLASVAASAWMDLRATKGEKPGRGRYHDLSRSLRHGGDLCVRFSRDDLSSFEDDDPSLVRATLCRLSHDPRLPLRYRVDTVAAHLRRGAYLGQPRATQRLRRRAARNRVLDRVAEVGEPCLAEQDRPAPSPKRVPPPAVQAAVTAPPSRPSFPGGPRCSIQPGLLREQITADSNLYAAWERVRDNARSRGTWSRSLRRFEQDLASRLASIGEALRTGTWEPGPLAHVPIKKSGGGTRHLHIPPVADRVAERAITQVIAELIDPHLSPWSFAFRPGRGVQDAVRELAFRRDDGATHVARFDIVDCFTSVDHDRLTAALANYFDDSWLLELVDQLIARDLPGIPRTEHLVGIAQGSPLSPLLANIVLEEYDRALFDAGFPPIRYADDLAVAAHSQEEAQTALQVAADRAGDLDLRLNPDKAEVRSFVDVVPFLGQLIGPDHPSATDSDTAPLPMRRTLYLSAKAGQVHLRRGQVRALSKDRQELLSVPVSGVARIVVMGPANVSAGLRSYAFRNDLEVLFLSRNGSWLGRYDGGCEVEPDLRRRQYAMMDDAEQRVRIARCLAAGKIANQRALLLRYQRGDHDAVDCGAAEFLADLHHRTLQATKTSEAMGFEGAATKRYYRALAALLPTEDRFRARTKRPPKDPVNAALSFGYTLLTGEAHAACASAGLDPQVGLLHASGRHRAALAFDLVEEFRPLIVDSIVVAGFRRGQFPSDRFRRGDKGAVLLNDRGRRTLIDLYESRMLSRYRSSLSGVRHPYRAGMREQARHLADVIAGREPTYTPIGWR